MGRSGGANAWGSSSRADLRAAEMSSSSLCRDGGLGPSTKMGSLPKNCTRSEAKCSLSIRNIKLILNMVILQFEPALICLP